ncbi:PREDICTED: BTB/POZ domain-containing protein At3g56230-like [Camelina sativa]|uniref:BTB/POZ domain-containing protein At3g56230-like n=1 Tax=Camelina sativa TaxID=90675 RepID=A0ABM0TJS2_CAMSA|nr:PREDICTED: BTB/POZ domain-containing protein At3g56230-like [Camelina sativa]XP_010427433.1 PREDICTED: BTB/POZ domain-containing protein At3g56230-like [Camelina sativa]XP_019085756.1 PREDICTED: BTB/POZ domain-containing protein At3g56230-like [Camelina sativa]
MPTILRPPRNTIRGSCYEGAKTTIALLKKLEGSKEDHDNSTQESTVKDGSSLSSSPLFSCEPQPLEKVIKWMKNMKETEEEQKKRIVFLSSFVTGFKEQLHADILLKAGDDGPPKHQESKTCELLSISTRHTNLTLIELNKLRFRLGHICVAFCYGQF